MGIAFDWARKCVKDRYVEVDPLPTAALKVLAAAVDCYDQPGVSEGLADILLTQAQSAVWSPSLSARLRANQAARRTIASIAIRKAPDVFVARLLTRLGLIAAEDVTFLLSELAAQSSSEVQERIADLITNLLPWTDVDSFDHALVRAQSNPILFHALKPHVAAVEFSSAEAERQRSEYAWYQQRDKKPAPERDVPQIDDLVADPDQNDHGLFAEICFRLGGLVPAWECPDGDVPPGFAGLKSDVQQRVLAATESYLKGYRAPNLLWIRSGNFRYDVGYGYWALLLLSLRAPNVFASLSDEVWKEWMPSAIGDPNPNSVTDDKHALIIKTAYRRNPTRFLKLLDLLIKVQNKKSGDIFVLDRVRPIWDARIADLLRSKLLEDRVKLKPRAFQKVLGSLINAGDEVALQLATDLVRGVTRTMRDGDLEKPLMAAIELLNHDAPVSWQIVWSAVQANAGFGRALLGVDPFVSPVGHTFQKLREGQLADLYIWVVQHQELRSDPYPAIEITPGRALVTLGRVVVSNLASRGTEAACQEIRRISEVLPGERLEWILKSAQELVRKNTWEPPSPGELLSLVLDASEASGRRLIDSSRASAPDLLHRIVTKQGISIETWASDHKFGRTTVFEWKAARLAGKPLKGKVSDSKSAALESAINEDAAALGLVTRTN